MGELPHDVDWAFVFRIDPDGNVSRVSSTSQEKRFHQMQPVPDNSMYNSENSENQGKYFQLGLALRSSVLVIGRREEEKEKE